MWTKCNKGTSINDVQRFSMIFDLPTYHVRRFKPYEVRFFGVILDLPTLKLNVINGRSLKLQGCIPRNLDFSSLIERGKTNRQDLICWNWLYFAIFVLKFHFYYEKIAVFGLSSYVLIIKHFLFHFEYSISHICSFRPWIFYLKIQFLK